MEIAILRNMLRVTSSGRRVWKKWDFSLKTIHLFDRRRENSCLLWSPDAYWAGLKIGAGTLMQVCVGGRNPVTWALPTACQGLHLQAGGGRARVGIAAGYSDRGVGVSSARANPCSQRILQLETTESGPQVTFGPVWKKKEENQNDSQCLR